MRPDGTLVGTHWGPISAIGAPPRRWHQNELWVHTPTPPWGSRRLPRTLLAGDPRRTLFRSLLRRSEGVPVAFPDGSSGTVTDLILPVLGFDFWPEQLVVRTLEGKRHVPVGAVARIDPRLPRIEIGEERAEAARHVTRRRSRAGGRNGAATTAPACTEAGAHIGRSSTPTTGTSVTARGCGSRPASLAWRDHDGSEAVRSRPIHRSCGRSRRRHGASPTATPRSSARPAAARS